MENDLIPITLSVEDGQKVFQALAELPFKYVYGLIGKLNQKANETAQVNGGQIVCEYALSEEEINLMIQALGQMPYQGVHGIIARLENRLNSQVVNG